MNIKAKVVNPLLLLVTSRFVFGAGYLYFNRP